MSLGVKGLERYFSGPRYFLPYDNNNNNNNNNNNILVGSSAHLGGFQGGPTM